FWSLEDLSNLPTREGFLASLRLLFGLEASKPEQRSLMSARVGFEIDTLLAASEGRVPDTAMLADAVPWFGGAVRVGGEQNFQHWELVFPEILARAATWQGFDLVVGNPPWIKIEWADACVLAEIDPLLGVGESRSATLNDARLEALSTPDARQFFAERF